MSARDFLGSLAVIVFVMAIGGQITLDNTKRGSSFRIVLPRGR